MATNIGAYFEIPVTDLDRAINFYQSLLGIELERGSIHGYERAFFPFENNGAGISGALCCKLLLFGQLVIFVGAAFGN